MAVRCSVGDDRFKHHARDVFINLFLVKTRRQETGDDGMHNNLERSYVHFAQVFEGVYQRLVRMWAL